MLGPERCPIPRCELRAILERVAVGRASSMSVQSKTAQKAWVDAVVHKLNFVEIFYIRDFVKNVMSVNRRLVNAGFRELHFLTLKMMLRVACEFIYEEGERNAPAGVLQDRDADVPAPAGYARREEEVALAARPLYHDDESRTLTEVGL